MIYTMQSGWYACTQPAQATVCAAKGKRRSSLMPHHRGQHGAHAAGYFLWERWPHGGLHGNAVGGYCNQHPCGRQQSLRSSQIGHTEGGHGRDGSSTRGSDVVSDPASCLSLGQEALAAGRLPNSAEPTDPAHGLCDRALWVRRLPWSIPRTQLEAQLLAAAPAAESAAVAPLRGRPRGTAAGADHRGHAVLVFKSGLEARRAMDALGQPGEGGHGVQGADHRGHAVLVFRSGLEASGAAEALRQPGDGGHLVDGVHGGQEGSIEGW